MSVKAERREALSIYRRQNILVSFFQSYINIMRRLRKKSPF
jgi:hypothetical protein